MPQTIRPIERDDVEPITAFTRDTWPDREYEDYLPDVLPHWVDGDDPDRQTIVADVDGEPVGVLQTAMLSPDEAWQQGMRVHPDYRGKGIGRELTHAGFAWAREQGAAVVRNMVFGWNAQGLGLSRAAGFEPTTVFRRATPEPEPTEVNATIVGDPGAAWRYWNDCEARSHLRGLAFDPKETWAVSLLTRARLQQAAKDDALLVVRDQGTAGFSYRNRFTDRTTDKGNERLAEYGVAAWRDADASAALFDAIATDAASVGADRCRVLIPETVDAVSDVALAGVGLAHEVDYVLAADLNRSFDRT